MLSFIKRFNIPTEKPQPLEAGVYHWQTPGDAIDQYRLHLRIEADQTGVLIVNAATILHLNTSAAAHVFHIVQGDSTEQAVASISERYHVRKNKARSDHDEIRAQIETLATNPEVDPVLYMDVDREEPYSQKPSAPYRLDLALTYRIDESGQLDPLARERVDRELSQKEWTEILRTAWEAGIPHVIFTGGEPTLREDLVDLIIEAEQLGQVTGVLTNGLRLSDPTYISNLEQAGLDHLLIMLDPDNPQSIQGLQNAIASDVFTVVHLTFAPDDFARIDGTLALLQETGAMHLSLSGTDRSPSTKELLTAAFEQAAAKGFKLVWDLPVPYSQTNPISAELEDAPNGAGIAWLYVEPDGDVLPAQGVDQVMGNLLREPFQAIWQT
jgi:hypothetical protein